MVEYRNEIFKRTKSSLFFTILIKMVYRWNIILEINVILDQGVVSAYCYKVKALMLIMFSISLPVIFLFNI